MKLDFIKNLSNQSQEAPNEPQRTASSARYLIAGVIAHIASFFFSLLVAGATLGAMIAVALAPPSIPLAVGLFLTFIVGNIGGTSLSHIGESFMKKGYAEISV